jgi:hypothetical protein
MTHVQLLCWTTAESLDRLVKQKRLDQELCHQLLSLKDLVLGLRQILAQAEREFCALRRDKYADNYSESSRRPACRNLYLLEHAVLGIQVCCALHPLLQLKLRHPSAAVCVWISRRSHTFCCRTCSSQAAGWRRCWSRTRACWAGCEPSSHAAGAA